MMRALDDFLIERLCQPVADWATDHYGRTTFWIAANCFMGAAASDIVLSLLHIQQLSLEGRVGASLVQTIAVTVWVLVCWSFWKRAMRRHEDALSARRTTMNIDRLIFRRLRLFHLALIVLLMFLFGPDLTDMMGLFFVAGLYFSACEARPPVLKTEKQAFAGAGA